MTTTKKPTAKKKPTVRGLKTVCNRVNPKYGYKVNGTLRKGFHYVNGKVTKKKPTVRKKPVAKKPATKRKTTTKKSKSGLFGLGIMVIL